MQLTPASATTASTGTAEPKRSDEARGLSIGYDAFLQLLLAQLKHQDPLKPMDSTEYVSQLATLSNLEQVIGQSKKLDSLISSLAISQAASIVGRKVSSDDGSIAGTVVTARVTSDGVLAELGDGRTLLLGGGVRVTAP